MSELLDQLIGLIQLRVQRPKQSQRFLFFRGKFFGRTAKKKEHSVSCKHRRVWKLNGSLRILSPFWQVTSKLLMHEPIGEGVACRYQFPMQLGDIVAARFLPFAQEWQMWIKFHPLLARLLFGKCVTVQPARDRRMAYSNLVGDGCL